MYAVFTGAAALSQNVWELGLFRLLAGIGIGGEWALAGTYVAEAWPEDRRKMGAGYLQTGYYAGFFLAAALNFTVGAHFGWRAMFLCGLTPALLSLYIVFKVKEPEAWAKIAVAAAARAASPLKQIFTPPYRRRTIVNAALLTVAIIGLWAGAVYEPTAVIIYPHFESPQFRQVLQPSIMTTAAVLHFAHSCAPSGKCDLENASVCLVRASNSARFCSTNFR
jgi:MFS family permease